MVRYEKNIVNRGDDKNKLVPIFYLTRCHYIIIHCTCTCIVQMKGTVTFLAKNLGWRTYTYKHARNSSGRLAICVIFYFMYHTHRSSFPDVLAMEAVTTHHSLISCLPNLPIRSANKQMELCGPHKSGGSTNLMPGEAKHYCSPDKETGPTWPGAQHSGDTEVQEWYYTQAFMEALKGKGVKSKALCIKLAKLVHSLPSKSIKTAANPGRSL